MDWYLGCEFNTNLIRETSETTQLMLSDIQRLYETSSPVSVLKLSPDKEFLACGTVSGDLYITNLFELTTVRKKVHNSGINDLTWISQYILTASQDGYLVFLDTTQIRGNREELDPSGIVYCVEHSSRKEQKRAELNKAIFCSENSQPPTDNKVKINDYKSDKKRRKAQRPLRSPEKVSISDQFMKPNSQSYKDESDISEDNSDEEILITLEEANRMFQDNVETSFDESDKCIVIKLLDQDEVYDRFSKINSESYSFDRAVTSCYSSGVEYFLSGGVNGVMKMWDLRRFQCVKDIRVHDNAISSIDESDPLTITASYDGTIRCIESATFDPVCTLCNLNIPIRHAVFFLNSKHALTVDSNNASYLYYDIPNYEFEEFDVETVRFFQNLPQNSVINHPPTNDIRDDGTIDYHAIRMRYIDSNLKEFESPHYVVKSYQEYENNEIFLPDGTVKPFVFNNRFVGFIKPSEHQECSQIELYDLLENKYVGSSNWLPYVTSADILPIDDTRFYLFTGGVHSTFAGNINFYEARIQYVD